MAYPTGLEETRAGTLSAHPGYVCRLGENGRGDWKWDSNADGADQHSVVVVGMVPGNGQAYPIYGLFLLLDL